jgi:hypothetical protein
MPTRSTPSHGWRSPRAAIIALRELLGDALDDPQARFEMELSLRAEHVHAGALLL